MESAAFTALDVSSAPTCASNGVVSTPQTAAQTPAFCTVSNSRKRRATSELAVDLPRALKLIRPDVCDPRTPLEQLERRICCRFDVESRSGWNEFCITMFGTDVGLRKGRSMIMQMIDEDSSSEPDESTGGFPFLRLPVELQEMIIDRVDCELHDASPLDGRALLPLRLVNQHVRALVDRTLEKGPRRCFKERICLGESMNGKIRLGFPPLVSKVFVSFDQLDSLFRKISTDVPFDDDGEPMKCDTEIFLKCDYRPDWCKRVMKLLLKHTHIQPTSLNVRGVICEKKTFSQYVDSQPALERLIFEKPLGKDNVYNGVDYMPYFGVNFTDLGPQFDSPQNVRKSYNIAFVYSRKPPYSDPSHQMSF